MIAKKSGLTFFDQLILWINYILAAAILVSYLAPVVDPRTVWIIAFFGLAYPPLLLINVILIVYWLFRKSKWALLSLVCILIGWKVLNSNIGFRLPSSNSLAPDSSRLRIMNYNVHDFKKYGSRNDISTKHEILDIIAHQQPDVICFEEFFSQKRGQYNMVDSIKKILNTNHYYFMPFDANTTEGIGMAVFSKYPIIKKDVIWLTGYQNVNQCLFADINKHGRIFRVYALHLQSIHFEAEDYKYLNGITKKGAADINSSRRIGSKLKHAFLKRSEQVALIKKQMAQCPYPYLVAGDFNDTPSSFAVNQMAKGLKNAFCEKGAGLGRTYNGDFPNYQIDYIMASKAFDVLTYDVVRKKLSDHYPVYSDVRLRQ